MSVENMQSFSHREQSRKKLHVYYGGNDNIYHSIRETTNNARDILQGVEGAEVFVELHEDGETITVKDNGSGLHLNGKSKVSDDDGNLKEFDNYKLLLLKLFTGTKMENNTEKENSGTNGCGNTVLCYTSEYMSVTSKREGKIFNIVFEDGGRIKKPLSIIGETEETGTEITFKLDGRVYTHTNFESKIVEEIVNRTCATSSNIKTTFKHGDIIKEFNYSDFKEYFRTFINDLKLKDISLPIKKYIDTYKDIETQEEKEEFTTIELILNSSDQEKQLHDSYLNGVYLPEQGTIHDGIISGVRKILNKFIIDNNLYNDKSSTNKEKRIGLQDIEETVSYACSVLSTRVSFSGQTKFKTTKELYKTNMEKHIEDFFEHYCIENKDNVLLLANRILNNKRSREQVEVKRKKIRKQLEEKITSATNRPDKFIPCRSKNPEEVELILIEGLSAKNSVVSSRNSKFMSVYPLKGKPMNPLKKDIDAILKNNEIKDIFKILGCGMTYKGKRVKGIPAFNINDLQIGKILITTDQDSDGRHIQCLLLGIFYTLSPQLIKEGKVYILHTPLYVITTKSKKELYAYSEEERNTIIRELVEKNDFRNETRYKGLGGLSSQVMSKTAMNIESRKLKQVTWEEVQKGVEMLELCLTDEKAKERKEYIEKNGHNFFDYSLLEG